MIPDASPVTQAALGTLFTWGLTAAGAALAIVIEGQQVCDFHHDEPFYHSTTTTLSSFRESC